MHVFIFSPQILFSKTRTYETNLRHGSLDMDLNFMYIRFR